MRSTRRSKRWAAITVVTLGVIAAACGTSDGGSKSTEAPTTQAGATTTAGSATTGGGTETTAGGTETTSASTDAGATTTLPPTPGPGTAGSVTVFGVEDSESEAGAEQAALKAFGDANGITVTYVGRRDFEQQINSQVLGGNPPDIALFPQPGKLASFAQDGDLKEVPADVVSTVSAEWADSYMAFSRIDGKQYGVPLKADLKSLVWYEPAVWKAKGYEVPTTLTAFKDLEDKMIANGDTPLCVGIESGTATGWPFTDWVEELILREQGIDYYNKWVSHEIPFNDQKVVDTFNEIAGPDGMWTKEGAVYASGGSIAATAFGDNAASLVQGKCMMHRQANFFAANFPSGTKFGDGEGEVSTFYFPSDSGHPVLVGGLQAAAFRDAPEVWKVMEYLGSADYANARQKAQRQLAGGDLSGFLTGNSKADKANWAELEQGFLETLATASPAAFDGSDNMPAEVGSGAFWTEGTSFVNGDEDAKTATDNIQAAWPS